MKQQSLKIFSKEETGPYELPKGWRWVRLGEVLKEDRKTINPQDYPAENFWLVTMDCVESNTGKLLKKINLCGKEIKSTKYQFNFNHVLYGKLRPYLNKVYAVPEGERGICTTEFIPFIPLNADKKYIAFYLRKKEVIEFAMNNLTGTRQPRVNIEALLSFQIPLPSLPEQKRIVARIEALFSKIDEIKRLRKEANDLAKTLLQSALHEVFSKADEKGWKWVRLGEIAFMRKQVIRPKGYPNEEFELYSIPAYHKTGYPEIRKGFEIGSSKFLVKSQDVLFGKLNPHIPKVWTVKNQTGKRQIATTEFFPIYAKNGNELLSKYLYWSLRDLRFLDSVLKLVIGTTGSRKRLQKGDFLNLEIPLPPLEEQKRIVAYLDTIQQKAQALQRLQVETEREIERLREAILHKAFRGEL